MGIPGSCHCARLVFRLHGWQVSGCILSGAVNPSGKLPFSFPAKLTDCGAHAFDELSYPGDSIKQEYKEDILGGAIVGTTPRRFRHSSPSVMA